MNAFGMVFSLLISKEHLVTGSSISGCRKEREVLLALIYGGGVMRRRGQCTPASPSQE